MNKNKNISKKNKNKLREKAEWDDTISNVKAYRASAEDVLERKLSHKSKHHISLFNSQSIESEPKESVYERLTKTRYGNKVKINEVDQRKDMLQNMFIPDKELFELFSQSEKALSNVENMFGDHKKCYRVTPSVTLAPNQDSFSKNSNNSNSCALNDFSNSEDENASSSKTDERSTEDDLSKFRKFLENEKKINNNLHNKLEEKRAVLLESAKKFDIGTETEKFSESNDILAYIMSKLENRGFENHSILLDDQIMCDGILKHFEKLEKEKNEELSSLRSELHATKELIDALTLELINNTDQMKKMKEDNDLFTRNITMELSQVKSYIIKYFDQRDSNTIPIPKSINGKKEHFSLADHLFKENFNTSKETDDAPKDDLSLAEQMKQLQFNQQHTQKRLNSLMKMQKSLTQMSGDVI